MAVAKAIILIIVGLRVVILRHVTALAWPSADIATHREIDRGEVYHPMPTIPHYHPEFAPPTLRRDRRRASPARPTGKSRVANEAQGDGLHGDVSSSL